MSSYKFVGGKAVLKNKQDLPVSPLMIPQPDGTVLPIPLIGRTEAVETLGVFICPAGTGDRQM